MTPARTEQQARAFNDWHVARYGCNAVDDAAGLYRYEGWMAAQAVTAARPALELRDKAGQPLAEGDIVIGVHSWAPSDGYLPKAAKKTVRALLRIHWVPVEGLYRLYPVGIHPEDVHAAKERWYRHREYGLRARTAWHPTAPTELTPALMRCSGLERLEPEAAQRLLAEMEALLGEHQVNFGVNGSLVVPLKAA